jgi:hypothetical protein
VSPSVTLVTSHSLDGPESEANHEEQRRFVEFVTARQPQLLDFQAYVSEDKRQLKLLFVFPDEDGGDRDATEPEPNDRRFQDSGLAGLLAGAAIVALFLAAVYLGSIAPPTPA